MNRFKRLRKIARTGLFIVAAIAVPAAPLFAEAAAPAGEVSVGVLSQYIWRGYESSRHSVVIQPSATVGYGGLSANLWGNLDTDPYAQPGEDAHAARWNETDLTLSYSRTLGRFTLGGGYVYCNLEAVNEDAADRKDSQELFATVSLDVPLTPTLTVYREFAHYRNWYFLLGVSHVFELGKAVSLKLAASTGYLLSTDADTYPKYDGDAAATDDKFRNFHDGTVSVSLPVKVTDRITLTPALSYIFPLTRDAKDEMKGLGLRGGPPADRDGDFWVGGITASFSF